MGGLLGKLFGKKLTTKILNFFGVDIQKQKLFKSFRSKFLRIFGWNLVKIRKYSLTYGRRWNYKSVCHRKRIHLRDLSGNYPNLETLKNIKLLVLGFDNTFLLGRFRCPLFESKSIFTVRGPIHLLQYGRCSGTLNSVYDDYVYNYIPVYSENDSEILAE